MSDAAQPQPTAAPSSQTPQTITRAGKACEPCRIRKTRCNIARQAICSECIKRDISGECKIREKARPNRPVSQRVKAVTSGQRASDSPRAASPAGSPAQDDSFLSTGPGHEDFAAPVAMEAGPSRLGWGTPTGVRSHPPLNTSTPDQLPRSQPQVGPAAASSFTGQVSASAMVEAILEEQAGTRYGLTLSVAMQPENIFKPRHSRYLGLAEMGLDPSIPGALAQAQAWINTHFRAVHHNTPFLHLPHVLDIASRLFRDGADGLLPVANDELALLYAVLALGSLREQTYDPQTGTYRTLPASTMTINDLLLGFGASPLSDQPGAFQSGSTAQSLFRLAQEELEQVEQPSETAVQALFLLHMFVCNTSMGRRSRDYVARAVMMSHELGLNRRIPFTVSRDDEHAIRRRAMLYLYVYFSDVYLSALESHPPLIKRHDYDPDVFAPIYHAPSNGIDTPSGTPINGLRDFVDLVTTIGAALERLHVGYHADAMPSIQLVLELDQEMDELRERLGPSTFVPDLRPAGVASAEMRSAMAGSVLRQIHYNWSRIALRAPLLRHPLLRHSSLAICARSALSILLFHRHVIGAGLLNLPWMQLRRIATSIYIVFIALWAGEITHADAEAAVGNTLNVLCVVCTRWKSATGVARTVVQLADASGLVFDKPQDQEADLQPSTTLAGSMSMPWDVSGTTGPNGNGQGVDMGLNLLADANLDWAALGAESDMFANWQTLHQPPW